MVDGWDFEPGNINVRIVRGLDGRDKVQMRIDLGVLQMEMDGRPDGSRPHEHESLLEYYEAKTAQARRRKQDFELAGEDCDELLREGIQYYYRYLSFFHLGLYKLAERDTRRNLRLFAFVRAHVTNEQDAWRFDQYRPYVTMMNTQARAISVYQAKRYQEALEIVEEGIHGIQEFLSEHDLNDQAEECAELVFLKRWREEIESSRPLDPMDKLQGQLVSAVEREDYERAAKLRDEIRKLQESS